MVIESFEIVPTDQTQLKYFLLGEEQDWEEKKYNISLKYVTVHDEPSVKSHIANPC